MRSVEGPLVGDCETNSSRENVKPLNAVRQVGYSRSNPPCVFFRVAL